eukprot:7749552-Lingulodinium_polyedra.AAC.1
MNVACRRHPPRGPKGPAWNHRRRRARVVLVEQERPCGERPASHVKPTAPMASCQIPGPRA